MDRAEKVISDSRTWLAKTKSGPLRSAVSEEDREKMELAVDFTAVFVSGVREYEWIRNAADERSAEGIDADLDSVDAFATRSRA